MWQILETTHPQTFYASNVPVTEEVEQQLPLLYHYYLYSQIIDEETRNKIT